MSRIWKAALKFPRELLTIFEGSLEREGPQFKGLFWWKEWTLNLSWAVTGQTQSLLAGTGEKHICSSSANLRSLAGFTLCRMKETYKQYKATTRNTHLFYVMKSLLFQIFICFLVFMIWKIFAELGKLFGYESRRGSLYSVCCWCATHLLVWNSA